MAEKGMYIYKKNVHEYKQQLYFVCSTRLVVTEQSTLTLSRVDLAECDS